MSNEGPTTTATINAKIKAEAGEAFATFEEVTVRAKALGAVDPDIKVNVKSDAALAKLAAVDAAQAKLGLATDRLKITYQRLDEIQTVGGAKQSTLMAAHLAAASAENAEAAATRRLAEAKASLAAEEQAETAATLAANEANKTNVSRMGLIISAVATLIPMLGPLAAYTVAVAGGLTAMGAAGILAIVGIRREMQDGTNTGKSYADGIRTLHGELDTLSHTAAVAMLRSYQEAVAQVSGDMPFLNTSTRIFTEILGNTGNRVLAGVISALHVLNPLFVSGALYVNQLALGFQKWTQDGGLEKFSDYALGALPRVADALGSIATALLHILEATAPLGAVTLAVLTGISDAISGMPAEVLVTIAAAATGGFLAFKAWGLIAPILATVAEAVGAVGVATQIAEGPIGWVAAGVTALAAVFAVATIAAQDQTSAVEDYSSALQEDMGVVGAATEKQAALNLQREGAFALAKKLGISQATLTSATLGNADAMKIVNDALYEQGGYVAGLTDAQQGWGSSTDQLTSKQWDQLHAAEALNKIVGGQQGAIKSQIDLYNELAMATGGTTISTQAQLDAANALAGEYGTSASAYQVALGGQKQTADQLAATTLQMRLQNDASGLLANALTILNGGSLSVAQTQTGLAAANNGVTDSFKANGKAIDGTTKAAVANQQAIQQQVSAAQQAAEAIGTQTGSSEKAVESYKASKDALEAQLSSQGLLTVAVQAYIDKLYDVSNLKVPPTKLDVDTRDAEARIAKLKALLNGLSGWTIGVNMTNSGGVVYSDARNQHNTKAGGGTVGGPGTTTSDSVQMFLSRGEEIIQEKSASQVRPLLKRINDNPARAISDLVSGASAGRAAPVHFHITNKSGVTLSDLIDVRIQQGDVWQAVDLSAGVAG